ncbi:serine aminopeptidase S33 family [Paraburkholderia eburnea]|uniref:Serine aminopeptidase S33 family n=1 Tax=Paraburkholderia eburnea TaxID=1189126 RepID=A0A2S4MMG0_9BURK|nr:alpha/beta hydrolase [Paraburkholderia eburnea]POR55964.1 serine aminopeptidase S33 family [Paraburkholderia eburnea]PRZ27091.1 serine aminopeptidase S33 family [Paraburkholderia eburnea]
MNAVVFEGAFGWLHPADGRTGVVLCNPFGYDALCTHRGWRKLAERLAAAGLPTLRFDYPGTGDAAGMEDDPGRVEAWIESIGAAVRHLRAWTGVTRVALVGLRLGATLAAAAAQRHGNIDDLVLLAPPVTGRRYIRELRAHRQGWLSTSAGMGAVPIADDAAYVEAFGFGLHGDDIATLSAVDLMRAKEAPARRVLLLDSSGSNLAASLAAHYTSLGAQVEQGGFEESDRFFLEALYSEEPIDAFSRVCAWLAQDLQFAPKDARRVPIDAQPYLRLEREGATERPVRFDHCFGIHCEPDMPQPGAPAVLLINTGAAHHIGDGRIAVLLARRLAQQGIASLRMDIGGLGDAQPPAPEVNLDMLYSTALRDDAASGADWLAARGHARIAAFGVCGGAFVSLHVSGLHPNIFAAYGVNLQKFTWDGAARSPGEQRMVSSKTYLHAVFSADKWKRALRGQTDSNPLRIAAVLAKRVARRALRVGTQAVARGMGRPVAANEACVLLHAIDAKKVQLRLVYGEYDSGLEEARLQLGASFAALKAVPNVRALTLPGLDHALFTREARNAVMADFEAWLCAESMREAVSSPAFSESRTGAMIGPLAGA